MKLINRDFYLKQLKEVIRTPDIKVIKGVRRSGKSKLMESYISYIQKNDLNANIIHINFNNINFSHLSEYHALYDYVENTYNPKKNNYVFIDEIQMCEGFEKAINYLHTLEKYDIYITGSNAFLLSSDLATLFTGRTFCIEVYPFSLKEFMKYYELNDQYDAFNRYLKEGGMSGSYIYDSEETEYKYISEVFNTIIVRDIKQKYHLRNMNIMDRLCNYLIDNISNETSPKKISNIFTNESMKISDKTISSYIEYLCHAFVFYKVRRYDIHGKRYLSINDKYYLCDHSIKYALLGNKNADYGRVIENIVAIDLLRRGYELYAGVLYKKEIDFVAIKRGKKLYIQVSSNIDDPLTFKREVDSLLQIRDAYPKMILSRIRQEPYQYEGIKIMDIADFLLLDE